MRVRVRHWYGALGEVSVLHSFWWHVCSNRLATKENQFRRKCAPSQCCPVCQENVESVEHLLFHFNWMRAVRFGCNLGLRCGNDPIISALQWTSSIMQTCSNDLARRELVGRAATVGWCIWKARNDWVFNQCCVDLNLVVHQVASYWWEINQAQHQSLANSQLHPSPSIYQPRWVHPSPGVLKINCDTSFSKNDSRAILAVILRDGQGKLIDGVVSIVHSSSTKQGEAHGIRLVCLFSQVLGLSNVQVEIDNKEIIVVCFRIGSTVGMYGYYP